MTADHKCRSWWLGTHGFGTFRWLAGIAGRTKKYGKPLKLPTNPANSRNCGMVFSISLSSYFLDNFSFKFRFVSCIFFSQEKIKQTVPPNHCLEKLLARSETGFQVRVGDVFSCCTKPTIFLEHQNDQWFVKGRSTTVYPSEGWTYTFVASSGFLASNGCKVSAKPGSCLGETCRSGLSCKGCLESGRNRHRWRIPYYVCIYLLRISWDRIIQGSCCGITTRKKVTKQPLFYFGWTRNLSRGEVLWKILPNSPKSGKLFEIVKEIGFRDRHFNIHRFFFPQKMARWSNLTRFFNWLANMAISNYTMNEDEFPIEYVDFLLLCKCTWDS